MVGKLDSEACSTIEAEDSLSSTRLSGGTVWQHGKRPTDKERTSNKTKNFFKVFMFHYAFYLINKVAIV